MLLGHPKPHESGSEDIVQLLLDHDWDVNEVNAEDQTPLHLAAQNGDRSVVQVLLNHTEVDLHARDQWESTALHEAAKQGHLAVVKLLLAEPSIDINARDRNNATPLWWATRGNHIHVAARLLAEPNVDINAVSLFERPLLDQSTSLHHAVQGRATFIIHLLLMENSLNPNVLDHQGWTPLSQAAQEGDVRTVEWLLGRRDIQCRNIDINQGWGGYILPLLAAIIASHPDVESALSLAARYGHLQVVDTILQDCRADRNSFDDEGHTALWWAAHEGQTAVVRRLLKDADVQVDIKDRQGADALEAARSQHHLGVIHLLQAS
ncbi:hypothetical protein CNMCM5878_006695 [Aspergillus fumigatiaffinis]|nr:hypothetical protein CNMCM5878_006695 [Aspergillus fumigatiaffinis]